MQTFSFWSFSSEKENTIGGISFEGIPSDFNYQISFNWIYYNHMEKIKYDLIVPSKLDIWFKNIHSRK